MKTFNEWLIENHPEMIDEVTFPPSVKKFGAAALLAAASFVPNSADGAGSATKDNGQPPITQKAQVQDAAQKVQVQEDIIEKNGMVYFKGSATPKDNSPKARMDALRVAETKIQLKAAKYFESKGGQKDFVPPGFKEINKSDFLSGKSNYIVWAWKIPN
jgi:hypothetical protein